MLSTTVVPPAFSFFDSQEQVHRAEAANRTALLPVDSSLSENSAEVADRNTHTGLTRPELTSGRCSVEGSKVAVVAQSSNLAVVTDETTYRVAKVLKESDDAIRLTLKQLNVPDDESEAAMRRVFDETLRLLPRFLVAATVSSQLDRVATRSARYARRQGKSFTDAADFGQDVAEHITKCLFGRWPKKNVGAWTSAVGCHLYLDGVRKALAEEKAIIRRYGDVRRRQ